MARVDRAKPGWAASSGDSSTRTRTAADRAGSACLLLPVASATRAITPMTAALSTLGEGRARTTKAPSRTAATTGLQRSPTCSQPHSTSAADSTTATFVPLTATIWISPVVRNACRSEGSRPLVSPSTSPGSNPASSSDSGEAALRSPSRNRPAAVCSRDGGASTVGRPRADSRAATSSPAPAACTRPSVRTLVLGSSPNQRGSVAKTRTGSRSLSWRPATCSCSTRTRATTSCRKARTASFGRTTLGSSSSTPSTTTAAPSRAATARARTRPAPAAPALAVPALAVPARSTRPAATADTADRASSSPTGSSRPCQATTHAAAAGTVSRRSSRSTPSRSTPSR